MAVFRGSCRSDVQFLYFVQQLPVACCDVTHTDVQTGPLDPFCASRTGRPILFTGGLCMKKNQLITLLMFIIFISAINGMGSCAVVLLLESLRLEKTFKIIWSNRHLTTSVARGGIVPLKTVFLL